MSRESRRAKRARKKAGLPDEWRPATAAGGYPASEAGALMTTPDVVASIIATTEAKHQRLPGGVLGFDPWHNLRTAQPRGAVLVLGPPGSGKTSSVLIPSVMIAPGACVASSLKSDVMEATWRSRAKRGRVWHFDPSGQEPTPAGVTVARWSPLVGVASADDALAAAARMAGPLRAGESGTAHFADLAERWLAVLLYAAQLAGSDMAMVAGWGMDPVSDETLEQLGGILDDTDDDDAPTMRRSLAGLVAIDARERSGVISTLDRLLAVYRYSGARRTAAAPTFDPEQFVRSGETLYITARADRQALYAPLLAGLLEAIRLAVYDRARAIGAGLEPAQPHVLFALDEADKTAPMPIPAIVAEAGGQGLHLVIGLQSIPLAVSRWGDSARDFLSLCTVKVVLRGVLDQQTTRTLAEAAGRHDVETVSWTLTEANRPSMFGGMHVEQRWQPNHGTTTEDVLNPGHIAGVPPGQALVFFGDDAHAQTVEVWGRTRLGMHWREPLWQRVEQQATENPAPPRHEPAPLAQRGPRVYWAGDQLDPNDPEQRLAALLLNPPRKKPADE